ncbi:hypothetical protein F0562_025131 [Nyssa sinensis]|uniref:non-specific serine/threonine protein kinase n=1 Tax=Nyssa sinensis TaxID=561372 RepID=A0A5J5BHN8_9ASTE|nr:hypothetical protein F0562_025131 [Nyssa sinensis]
MQIQVFSSSLLHSTTIILSIFLITVSLSHAQDDEPFWECKNRTYSCGPQIRGIGYPFWGGAQPPFCGHPDFELKCQNNEYATIDMDTHPFRVLAIDRSMSTMTMARQDLWDDHCHTRISNVTLNDTLFGYPSTVQTLNIFYNCNCTLPRGDWNNVTSRGVRNNFTCSIDGLSECGFYVDDSFLNVQIVDLPLCEVGIEVQVLRTSLDRLGNGSLQLQQALNLGFEVSYNGANCSACEASGGICGSDSTSQQFVCFCRDQPYYSDRFCGHRKERLKWGLKLVIAGASIFFMCLIFFIYHRWNKKRCTASSLVSQNTSYSSSMTDLEKSDNCYGVQKFSYGELEEATNNFDSKKELGDGGFGAVYQGKLQDGRVVAVKRLYENNFKRVEQFMNEVVILTRLRHQNLVSLYGCTSRHCRELLLVYEYIPNGTVADHLHGDQAKPGSLTWSTRMNIAIDTASALAFLHASDVIHRDVKTNNILLDNNLGVKVADFGLSRLFPNDVTHVTTAPQGTPGYVDPEYHQCYQLTDKSDVYSFGVVLLELISSMRAVDITRHRHEINLSEIAINKIQNHALHELVDPCLGFETDSKVRRMINDVAELAFRCLQNKGEMRPHMEEVLESLKRIQIEGYDPKKPEEIDIPADVLLLKSDSSCFEQTP